MLILYQRDLGLDSTDIFSQASAAHPTIDPLAFVFTLIMIGMKVGMVMVMSIMLFLMMVMMMLVVMIVVMMMMMVMIVVMMMLVVMMLTMMLVVVKCRIGVARRFSKAGKQIGTEAAFPVHGW